MKMIDEVVATLQAKQIADDDKKDYGEVEFDKAEDKNMVNKATHSDMEPSKRLSLTAVRFFSGRSKRCCESACRTSPCQGYCRWTQKAIIDSGTPFSGRPKRAALAKAIPAIEKGMGRFLQTKAATVLQQLSVSMDMSNVDRQMLPSFLTSKTGYAPASGV